MNNLTTLETKVITNQSILFSGSFQGISGNSKPKSGTNCSHFQKFNLVLMPKQLDTLAMVEIWRVLEAD
jgi:hypothetical protein